MSVRRAIAIYQIAIFLNWLLPIRGGEVAMSLLLRRTDGIPVNESLAGGRHGQGHGPDARGLLLAVMPLIGPAAQRDAVGGASRRRGGRLLRRHLPGARRLAA